MHEGDAEQERARDLMAVAKSRDREAFARLFDYYAPRVHSYLERLGVGPEQADELTQEVMLTIWRKAEQYDPARATPSTWIFRIARNRRIDALRRERGLSGAEMRELEEDIPKAVQPGEELETANEAAFVRRSLERAIAELPPEQAEVLRLYYLEEMGQGEIADALGLPLGTVKSRLRLALDKLRDYFAENRIERK